MEHFDIISSQGQHPVIWSGAPKYVGAYLKPGYLEFPAIGSPTPLSWHVGDYVVYSRTGKTYRLYRTPQAVEQGLSNKYGASFLYENVQFFDDSKQLEFCPFTDLVPGDNTVHFSTQNVVSFFGKPANVAERIQACLEAQYGAGTWEVRVVTTSDADLLEILNTEIEFSVTGANCQEVLDKVYEQWNGLGWIHTVENGKNVITIGASNVRTNANTTVPFAFDNGLVRVERSIANADQIGTRLFAYGSMKNMDATYYRGLDIKDAESVDIEHLMIPIANWGITDGKPDARKAYIENATAIASLGLIPKTAYFDGSGDLPDIHPTIERMTIGEVYDAGGAGYVPDLSKWSRSDRIDELVSAVNPSDHGTSADQGQKYIETLTGNVAAVTRGFSPDEEVSIGIYYATVVHAGNASLRFGQNSQALQIIGSWTPAFNLSILISAGNIKKEIPIVPTQVSSSEWSFILPESVSFGKVSAGATISVSIVGFVSGSASSSDAVALVTDSGTSAETSVEHEIDKTFTVRIPQLGFDIEKYAELGNGKILSMKTGMCGARDFEIKDVRYVASADAWDLTLYRSVDEGLNIMFPNADYQIASGDQFVLLDIAMPEMYVTVASSRLLAAAQKLLADISSEKPFYNPQVDAKVVYNEGRILREGMWMDITQEGNQAYCLIDSITIDENGSNIPTYEVALREKKGIDWTENVGKSGSSKSSVSVKGGEEVKTNGTVTSVGMTAPTGLEVEGSPITGTGVLKLKLASGYKIPLESELAPYFEQDDQIATLVKLKAAYSYLGPKKGLIFDTTEETDVASSPAHLMLRNLGTAQSPNYVLYTPFALFTGGDQIVGSGTPGGGGGGGAGFLYELGDIYHDTNKKKVLRDPDYATTSGQQAQPGDVLVLDSTYGWAAVPSASIGGVTSVVGQTGDVTAAQIATALTSAGYKLTDTTYTAGTGLTLSNGQFSVTANTYAPFNSSMYFGEATNYAYARFTSAAIARKAIDYYIEFWQNPGDGGAAGYFSSRWGNITAAKFIVSGGTSSQFLKANGTVDSTAYLPLSAGSGNALTGDLYIKTSSAPAIYFYEGSTMRGSVYSDSTGTRMYHVGTGQPTLVLSAGTSYPTFRYSATDYTIYHSGNSNSTSVAWSASSLTLNGALSGATSIATTGTVMASSSSNGITIGGLSIAIHNTSGAWLANAINFDTSGNVGIGTASPAYKFHVAGVGYFAAADADLLILNRTDGSVITWLTYYGAGSLKGRIGVGSDGCAYFHNGSAYYQMWHAGNLTKSVLTTLLEGDSGYYVKKSGDTMSGALTISKSGTDSLVINRTDSTPFITFKQNGTISGYIGVSSSGSPIYYDTTARTIYHSGNANKSDVAWTCYTLTVGNTLYLQNNQDIYWKDSGGTYRSMAFLSAGNSFVLGGGLTSAPSGGYLIMRATEMRFQTCALGGTLADRMWINSSGNVGIGTNSPAYKLDVYGTIASNSGVTITSSAWAPLNIVRTGIGSSLIGIDGNGLYIQNTLGSSSSYMYVQGGFGLKITGALQTTGDQVISSDINLKENLAPVTYGVEDIAKTRAVTFDWKDGRGHSAGSIAQDWKPLIPELVHGEEGNMTLAYGQIALVNTILLAKHETEQDKEIARLKERVRDLEKQLNIS